MTTDNNKNAGQTSSTKSQVEESASNLAEQGKAAAGKLAQDATSAAAQQADAAKSSVADEVSGVASALRTAAEEMRSGSPQERTFGQIAEGLADASDAMREKDLSTMVQDVSAFARKNPMVFLGGAALIGFAATRFAKASGDTSNDVTHTTPTTYRSDFS
ncbi:hypothetical protein OS189_15310 [Sulfitobacter sp. F26169L]|uniref:hypothetical protein n=1 Tax=Sulfitobacter sp. F26169L TaxID=2996015 RepID=UPI002260A33C|nr:hypothetical protein [Sulfitobacter sp. F26169L]MCX7567714.1 hypothetical protein [Sulfitobacter sp. F26169L]